MRNIKLILQYDGTGYRGWQRQKQGEPTVQDEVETCIARITGRASGVKGSGRTDSGVHALGQVAVFRTDSPLSASIIKWALNATLPGDIRVVSVEETERSFHPQFSAHGKRYVYIIANMDYTPAFLMRYVWHVPQTLDVGRMRKAAGHLLGRHDFRAFMASGSGAKNTVREIKSITVQNSENIGFLDFSIKGGFIKVAVEGDGFLRHMVRNIIGTLVDVGKGAISADTLVDIISSRDRGLAGPTAPAKGLYLDMVSYFT
jgi:tRNA pseudouridine38-40 synthase